MNKNHEKIISFPKQATVTYIDSFLLAVREVMALADSEVILDFSKTTELSSLAICFLCGLIDLARQKNNHGRIILPRNKRAVETLRKVKLLTDSSAKLPIKIADRMLQVRRIEGSNSVYLQDMIEILEHNLPIPPEAKSSLIVVLNELLTNAIDHSGQRFCYVCMGGWGRSKNLHVAFLDFGVGMPQSIRTRYPQYEEDSEAMKAILNRHLTVREDRVGGKGYELIQNVLKSNGGRLHIFSGRAKTVLKYDKREYNYRKARQAFVGTCVDIQYNLEGPGLYEIMGEAKGDYFS